MAREIVIARFSQQIFFKSKMWFCVVGELFKNFIDFFKAATAYGALKLVDIIDDTSVLMIDHLYAGFEILGPLKVGHF